MPGVVGGARDSRATPCPAVQGQPLHGSPSAALARQPALGLLQLFPILCKQMIIKTLQEGRVELRVRERSWRWDISEGCWAGPGGCRGGSGSMGPTTAVNSSRHRVQGGRGKGQSWGWRCCLWGRKGKTPTRRVNRFVLCGAATPRGRWQQQRVGGPVAAPLLQPLLHTGTGPGGPGQRPGECLTPSPHGPVETTPTPYCNPSLCAEPPTCHGFIFGAHPCSSAALCLGGQRTGRAAGHAMPGQDGSARRQEQPWPQHTLTTPTACVRQNLPLVSSTYSSLGGSQCPHLMRAHQEPAELMLVSQLMRLPAEARPEALVLFLDTCKASLPCGDAPSLLLKPSKAPQHKSQSCSPAPTLSPPQSCFLCRAQEPRRNRAPPSPAGASCRSARR